jgi:Mg-chelatase subunit ChlD
VPASAIADGAIPAGAAPASGAGSSFLVEASFGEARKRATWNGQGEEFTIEIDAPQPVKEPIALDVLFLIDTTGSMGDEIDRIKSTLLAVTKRLRSIEREFDLRYGAVLYKDLGDEYVTKVHPFTGDIEAFDRALKPVGAGGGGDEPESLNQGLAEAVRMDFRERAAKVMFLIADAPPHMDYAGDVRYGESLKAAVDRGIRIHSVAASGLNPTGTFIFRQIAQYTRGKFIFIEYGSTAESAAAHGVTGKVSSNNLDDIVFEQIREEVALWGR